MLLLIESPQAEAGTWKGKAGSPSTASTSAVSAYSFTSLIFPSDRRNTSVFAVICCPACDVVAARLDDHVIALGDERATVRDLSTSLPKRSQQIAEPGALPSNVPDHLLVPMLIQRKSSDMPDQQRSVARPAKISSISFCSRRTHDDLRSAGIFAGSIATA